MFQIGKFSFSEIEIRDIIIALVVLSLVFSYPEFLVMPMFILISFLAIGIAFVGHELMHKFVAQYYGYWSEFRLWQQGLVLAIMFALISNGSFIFAAPGAVIFSRKHMFQSFSKEKIGKIGIAGVVFNLVIVFALLPILYIFPLGIIRFMIMVNAWLAIFNLIPIPPLDGQKVMSWNWKIWLITILLGILGFFAVMYI